MSQLRGGGGGGGSLTWVGGGAPISLISNLGHAVGHTKRGVATLNRVTLVCWVHFRIERDQNDRCSMVSDPDAMEEIEGSLKKMAPRKGAKKTFRMAQTSESRMAQIPAHLNLRSWDLSHCKR